MFRVNWTPRAANSAYSPSAVAADTNVYRFYSAYSGYASAAGITSDYVPGVGTRFGVAGKIIGGAFGVGWLDRINHAHQALCLAYGDGDHAIDVIGFSRGSAIALDFVNKVHRDGIAVNGKVIEAHPAIRFVGLFDVVAAFGVANLGFVFNKLNAFQQLTLPPSVQDCFHAMALDERRPSFVNQRVNGAYEVWFRGAHSDIGGGNNNPGLEYVALRWMYRKAILCGLPVTEANITDSAVHPETPIKPNVLGAAIHDVPIWREVDTTDLIHYTVAQHTVLEGERCKVFPSICPIETVEFERSRRDAPPTHKT
jgi:uncharacterized protein (DUF2235 family)